MIMKFLLFTCVSLFFVISSVTAAPEDHEFDREKWPNRQIIFEEKVGDYNCYKIPYLFQTTKGTLIALAEARAPKHNPDGLSKGDCMDWDITDMVARRSTDNGQTWGPMQVIVQGRFNYHLVAGNFGVVQDQMTGRIHAPFTYGNAEMFVMHSDDDGLTWAKPRKLELPDTNTFYWAWIAFGPSGGSLQLKHGPHRGRLIVPSYFSDAPIWDMGSVLASHAFMLYSDDHGETWHASDPIPNGFLGIPRLVIGNENQVVELDDGTVLCNARTFAFGRLQAWSYDGGLTFERGWERSELPNSLSSGCQGAIVVENEQDKRLIYSGVGPDNWTFNRQMLTWWESADNGESYQRREVLDEASVAYSSLVKTWDGEIALVWERAPQVGGIFFVPTAIYFDKIETGRPKYAHAPIPLDENLKVEEKSYDMQTWQAELAQTADVYILSGQWWLFMFANFIIVVPATFLIVAAGLCYCPCCCQLRDLTCFLSRWTAVKIFGLPEKEMAVRMPVIAEVYKPFYRLAAEKTYPHLFYFSKSLKLKKIEMKEEDENVIDFASPKPCEMPTVPALAESPDYEDIYKEGTHYMGAADETTTKKEVEVDVMVDTIAVEREAIAKMTMLSPFDEDFTSVVAATSPHVTHKKSRSSSTVVGAPVSKAQKMMLNKQHESQDFQFSCCNCAGPIKGSQASSNTRLLRNDFTALLFLKLEGEIDWRQFFVMQFFVLFNYFSTVVMAFFYFGLIIHLWFGSHDDIFRWRYYHFTVFVANICAIVSSAISLYCMHGKRSWNEFCGRSYCSNAKYSAFLTGFMAVTYVFFVVITL